MWEKGKGVRRKAKGSLHPNWIDPTSYTKLTMAQLTRTMMPSGLSRFGMMNAFLLASIPMAIIIPFIWLKRLGITSPINTNKETQLHGMPMRGDYAMRSSLTNRQPYQYSASPLEQYFLDNVEEFGLLQDKHIETCPLVFNASSPINTEVLTYFDELEVYNQAMDKFEPITQDIRINIQPGEANIEEVCSSTKIHPNGLKGIFSSRVSSSNYHGGMEPLLPIQRSQKICNDTKKVSSRIIHLLRNIFIRLSSTIHHLSI